MDNRKKILECAQELFYQRGYDAVGIQEICQMAGITKPTLYHYFGSKFGLLETLLEDGLSGFMEQMSQAATYGNEELNAGRIEEALYRFASVIIDFANCNHKGYMFLMSLSYSAKENEAYQAVKPYITKIYYLAVRLFDQASGQLGNMNGRQNQFAIGFLGLINHYILFLEYQEEDRGSLQVSEERKNSLIHQFMHGIWT